ncbi:MAG: flavin reductase domain protein FMN-binding protein [Frankiales bacterium]|nr:flavin reductase domain protein FMN-binding protein [Frankiales bacterium]
MQSLPETGPVRFREVLSHFASGVVVVTAVVDGTPLGLTCQSFTSLSLDPPLVLFCPAKTSRSWPLVSQAPHLCINVLSTEQQALSDAFARSGSDKFAGVDWSPTPAGAPALAGAHAHLEASVRDVFEGGDHWIVTCTVSALDAAPDLAPLLYYRSSYRALGEGGPARV